MIRNKIAPILLVILATGLLITPVYGVTIQDVSTEETIPGGQITISVNVSNTGGVTIQGIPTGWSIDRYDEDGGIVIQEDGNEDGHNESIGWAWPEQQSTANPTVTLNIPSDETPGEQNVLITALEGQNETTTTTTLTVQNPQDAANTDQNTTNNNENGNQTESQPGFTILAGLIAIISIYTYRKYN